MTRRLVQLKFMQTLSPTVYSFLREEARRRGISVQQLVRAIIIPEWLQKLENGKKFPSYDDPFSQTRRG
jgi:hypothetical protein